MTNLIFWRSGNLEDMPVQVVKQIVIPNFLKIVWLLYEIIFSSENMIRSQFGVASCWRNFRYRSSRFFSRWENALVSTYKDSLAIPVCLASFLIDTGWFQNKRFLINWRLLVVFTVLFLPLSGRSSWPSSFNLLIDLEKVEETL